MAQCPTEAEVKEEEVDAVENFREEEWGLTFQWEEAAIFNAAEAETWDEEGGSYQWAEEVILKEELGVVEVTLCLVEEGSFKEEEVENFKEEEGVSFREEEADNFKEAPMTCLVTDLIQIFLMQRKVQAEADSNFEAGVGGKPHFCVPSPHHCWM